jgi:hypothetical protein
MVDEARRTGGLPVSPVKRLHKGRNTTWPGAFELRGGWANTPIRFYKKRLLAGIDPYGEPDSNTHSRLEQVAWPAFSLL